MSDKNSFFRKGKFLLSFGFLAVFMGNFGQSFFIGSYGASIQQALELSASGYGLVYSVATLIAGTSIMFIGGYIDRIPLRHFVLYVAAGLFIGSLIMFASVNVWILGCGLVAIRLCGQGLLPHTGITTMARCFDSDRGKAISIAASGVPAGEILLPIMAAVLIAQLGWQQSWLVVAALVPLGFIPVGLWLLKNAEKSGFKFTPVASIGGSPSHSSVGRSEVLLDGRFWRVLPAVIAGPFVVTGVFIHQSFYMQQKLWSMELFASSFIAYGVVHWISSLAAGVMVDRYSAVRLLAYYNLPLAAAMLVVGFVDGPLVPFLMLGLLGMSIGFGGPVAGALWAEAYGTGKIGSIRSMTTSFGVWATSLSPIILGVLIDADVSISLLSLCMALAVFAACVSAAFSYK